MKAILLLVVPGILFASSALASQSYVVNQDVAPQISGQSGAATEISPFQLAYDNRFKACNQGGNSQIRAQWVLDQEFAAGHLSEDDRTDTNLRDNVAMFLHSMCPGGR
jgi:hypothetical protein